MFGLDLVTGRQLFTPFRLDFTDTHLACYQNGETSALCLDDYEPEHVGALDLARGAVTYSGETGLNGSPAGPNRYTFHVVGGHLVGGQDGRGLYGIDAHGQRDWFFPGDGWPVTTDSTVLTQIPNPDAPDWRVISVAEGTDLTPAAPTGTTLRRATTYPGGFAYQYDSADGVGVLFYDTAGRLLHQQPMAGYNLLDGIGLPIVFDQKAFHVFSASGQPLAQIPADRLDYGIAPRFRLIGDQLMYKAGQVDEW